MVTFKKSTLPSVLATAVPLERIVVETDAPYLTPTPHRGKRNEPAFVSDIAAKMAEIKNLPLEKILETTQANAEAIASEEFFDWLVEKGALFAWILVTNNTTCHK